MSLNFRTICPPAGLLAAAFIYEIGWQVNPMSDGIIVQEMHWDFDVRYTQGGTKWNDSLIKQHLGMPDPVQDWFNYWERWIVTANPPRIDPVANDRIALTMPNPLFPFTVGTITINALASFYAGLQTPFEFRQQGGLAGGLASVLSTPPPLPQPTALQVERTIIVSWDCSDSTNGQTQIIVEPNVPLMNLV